jgi:hypothetical protein
MEEDNRLPNRVTDVGEDETLGDLKNGGRSALRL